jgi:hypothetical protein
MSPKTEDSDLTLRPGDETLGWYIVFGHHLDSSADPGSEDDHRARERANRAADTAVREARKRSPGSTEGVAVEEDHTGSSSSGRIRELELLRDLAVSGHQNTMRILSTTRDELACLRARITLEFGEALKEIEDLADAMCTDVEPCLEDLARIRTLARELWCAGGWPHQMTPRSHNMAYSGTMN